MSAVLADVETESLEALAEKANREHEAGRAIVRRAWCDGAQHAIEAGMALMRARELTAELGTPWRKWCEANLHFPHDTAKRYMRIAWYRAEVENWIAAGGSGKFHDALRFLSGLPAVNEEAPKPDSLKVEACRLYKQGHSIDRVAELVGVHRTTAREWLDADYLRKRRQRQSMRDLRQRRALRALSEKEKAELAKGRGGSTAKAYALLRRCALELDAAIGAAKNQQERELLRTALAEVHRAEDSVVASSKRAA